jgi:hypothetical protein
MTPRAAGYSGTRLAKKLGIKEGTHVLARRAPGDYLDLLAQIPNEVTFDKKLSHATDIVHIFTTRLKELRSDLIGLRDVIRSDAAVWVSWPKKTSKVPTDITEDRIREVALPIGFVDVKVCAVSDVWSGLKLVIRKELR